ncbi:tRNA 2-thiouridine(34) synthase MnmA [Candidatus Pacearchaeota archaeon]|nr:tRNA 2-thiouridine(34) synthase MnmA [Candidatus Pacearchaeota archaeon]
MKQKVLVAMSGGVDSSVAALIMKKKGYEVIGAFMKNWSDSKNEFGECNWKDERRHAMKIASILNVPLITLDFEKEYRRDVIEKMFKDYKKGITPNPDVDCNQKVKFPLLIKAAKKLGAKYVVTGHYSRIQNRKGKYELVRGKDEMKDQSYFLYRINQTELKHLLLPIGDYKKEQIRKIAERNHFPNFNKKSTVGICFVGKVNLKKFLQKRIKPKDGKILDPEGNVIGKHDGIYYYTIGQRIGTRFGINIEKIADENNKIKRWYVAKKDAKKNILVAAPEGHELLYRKDITIKNHHWINSIPKKKMKVLARIRQVGELLPATLSYKEKKFLAVER